MITRLLMLKFVSLAQHLRQHQQRVRRLAVFTGHTSTTGRTSRAAPDGIDGTCARARLLLVAG
jgi:hypothetical protein